MAVSRYDTISLADDGVSLSCSQIRTLFFMEHTVQGALNSNFFDSGVPISVTKDIGEQPTDPPQPNQPNQAGSGLGSGESDISLGLGGSGEVTSAPEGTSVLITHVQLYPTFTVHSDGPSILEMELNRRTGAPPQ